MGALLILNERGLWYRTGGWVVREAADTIGTIYTNDDEVEEEIDIIESTTDDNETLEMVDESTK